MSELSSNVKDIVHRFENGGPFYYLQDGYQFFNLEQILPKIILPDAYHEYTVGPAHMPNRGKERIVVEKYFAINFIQAIIILHSKVANC